MTRLPGPFAATLLLALVLAAGAAGAAARTAGSPFYLVPSPTSECRNVRNCIAVTGPWVVIPAHSEATYLLRCPEPTGYEIGGTDARATSSDVRVWFDGQLGAPIGTPSTHSSGGAVLLFHAVTNSGRPGSFEPILGCVTLKQKSPRSVLSARAVASVPGRAPGVPLDYRARLVPIEPGVYYPARFTEEHCPAHERLVGSWTALTFPAGAPDLAAIGKLTVARRVRGNYVRGFMPSQAALFGQGGFPVVQVGAMCQLVSGG